MRRITLVLLLLQAGAIAGLVITALLGQMWTDASGLHVRIIMNDGVAMILLAACVLSCITAVMLLEGFRKYRTRAESLGFFGSVLVGGVTATPFAYGDGPVKAISALAMVWLFALVLQFAVHASDERARRSLADGLPNAEIGR